MHTRCLINLQLKKSLKVLSSCIVASDGIAQALDWLDGWLPTLVWYVHVFKRIRLADLDQTDR